MYCGGASCQKTATKLGMGAGSVTDALNEVATEVIRAFGDELSFPVSEEDVAHSMNGFENICGLPYCMGAVDGTHIP